LAARHRKPVIFDGGFTEKQRATPLRRAELVALTILQALEQLGTLAPKGSLPDYEAIEDGGKLILKANHVQ
jgi:hypothetical protein